MITTSRFVLLCCIALTGCVTVKRAAVSTFRVIDTPNRLVRERIDPETTTTTTTTTEYGTSDVAIPGRPVVTAPPTAASTQRVLPRNRASSPAPTSTRAGQSGTASTVEPKSSPSATPRPSTAPPSSFPTAKPVPGKPGYVYSIDPNGGIVDVTGYKPGDKAKDPYTQQIFIVP